MEMALDCGNMASRPFPGVCWVPAPTCSTACPMCLWGAQQMPGAGGSDLLSLQTSMGEGGNTRFSDLSWWRAQMAPAFKNRWIVRSSRPAAGAPLGKSSHPKCRQKHLPSRCWRPDPPRPGTPSSAHRLAPLTRPGRQREVDKGDLETSGLPGRSRAQSWPSPSVPLRRPLACLTGEGSSRCPGGALGVHRASLSAAASAHSFRGVRLIHAQFSAGGGKEFQVEEAEARD